MSFWIDDVDIFFADFGSSILWNSVTYKGIFYNEYEAISLFEGEIESRAPYVEVREADFSGVAHDDQLTINSVAYKVKEIKPDGTGIMTLILSKD